MVTRSLFALVTALAVGSSITLAGGLTIYGATTSFGSQRSFVNSSFKTTPSGIVTDISGNQTSSTGVDSVAEVATTMPGVSAVVDTWGSAGVSGAVSTKIQTSGAGFAPISLFGSGEQISASNGRATARVTNVATPPCFVTCW